MDIDSIIKQLIIDEGMRQHPYQDTVNKTTIGIGRNLTDVGISQEEAIYLCKNDIEKVISQLNMYLPWFVQMSPARQEVLVNMAFNLGINGLLSFKQTLTKMEQGDYNGAACGMAASKWAVQVGARATRLIDKMRLG